MLAHELDCGQADAITYAIHAGDSKVTVVRKIGENRETVRRAVNRLKDAAYVTYDDGSAHVDPDVTEAGIASLAASATGAHPTIAEAYVLPQFAGLAFAYTGTDGGYVWTWDGYQVARGESDYPLFIAVRQSDRPAWRRFFERFGIPAGEERRPPEAVDGPLQVVLDLREQLNTTDLDGHPVVPLSETIAFAYAPAATFEPALAMFDRMYETADIETDYRTEPAQS